MHFIFIFISPSVPRSSVKMSIKQLDLIKIKGLTNPIKLDVIPLPTLLHKQFRSPSNLIGIYA